MSLGLVSLLDLTGTTVPAHRAILVARCEVMAAMFNGNYMEAKSVLIPVYGVSKETFLSFLEYLYTDSCCPGEPLYMSDDDIIVAKSCPALCDFVDCSKQVPVSSTISQPLLRFMSTESMTLSNHLVLYLPFLLLPSVFPSISVGLPSWPSGK